jgi:threonine dehydrogenase-like Zn-dependent dehydrogenase
LIRNLTLRMTTAPIQQTWVDLLPLVTGGSLRTDGIFTHRFPLEEAADAYAAVAARSPECVKVILTP